MEIRLLGALDYNKVAQELKDKKVENVQEILDYLRELNGFEIEESDLKKIKSKINKILEKSNNDTLSFLDELEIGGRVEKVSASGRLSRFAGDVFEVIGITENNTIDANIDFAKRVISMGHDSITDHDYLVFAIKNVSPVVEQTIIAERFSSFTIKSRREVDFSKVGFYIPDFHDENGVLLSNNMDVRIDYQKYMESLFKKYAEIEGKGLPKEDARFILPYSYNSNIIMGIDAHTLKDMIIKFTKTHLAKIPELREFGEKLFAIAYKYTPYIVDEIYKYPSIMDDPVSSYLNDLNIKRNYKILDKVKLLNSSLDIDNTILASAIMRRYQYNQEEARKILSELANNDEKFKETLMRKITFEGDKAELAQVNFEFQIPLSLAVLTHLTRHRTHQILIPEFAPIIDLMQYKVPPKAKAICPGEIESVFEENNKIFEHFKSKYNIREEDLIYFTLSGNMVNVVSNMDGKTVEHILGLRECSKAQWETQEMARGMHSEIDLLEHAKLYSSILGSTCMTLGVCNEGKESCGRVLKLNNRK